MGNKPQSAPSEDINKIIESAKRLGIELDEMDAIQWLTAMTAEQNKGDVVVDEKSGVFGHRISMLDFNPAELAHFRKIGELVGFEDTPGVVETALALSGSSAQSKIQTYPGDCDYFERVNIKAPTKEEACRILSEIMQKKIKDTFKGTTYQLIEIKFGSFPFDVIRKDNLIKAGSPISWNALEALEGKIALARPDGTPIEITWDEVRNDPGWTKLDWVVTDTVHGVLVNASNMLDVTWEAPDGSITPLDGYLDPYFQEVYLEAESIPVFTKLSKQVSADALEDYVHQLEYEVKKYLTRDINYGKAAKRMYNIFRLTGRYQEAAFIRELFDEPTTVLYQVWSLIRTMDDCFKPGSNITLEALLAHVDQLIYQVVKALEGEEESEIVRLLLRLRDVLSRERSGQELSPQAEAARDEVINIVNNFYYDKLSGIPTIKTYIESMAQA